MANIKLFVKAATIIFIPSVAFADQKTDSFGFTPDDYAIYNVVLSYSAHKVEANFVVTGSKRWIDFRQHFESFAEKVPPGWKKSLEAFLDGGGIDVDWTGLTDLGFEVMDADSFDAMVLRDTKDGIGDFQGSVELFPIGYDRETERALTYFTWARTDTGGQGIVVLLSRASGDWRIFFPILIWES